MGALTSRARPAGAATATGKPAEAQARVASRSSSSSEARKPAAAPRAPKRGTRAIARAAATATRTAVRRGSQSPAPPMASRVRDGIAPAQTALGTRFRNSITRRAAMKRTVSRSPRRYETASISTRRLNRARPPLIARGAEARRIAPTPGSGGAGSPRPVPASSRIPRRIGGTVEATKAHDTVARPPRRPRATATRMKPERRRARMSADSRARYPRARRATPRNSLQPARMKKRTRGTKTGAQGSPSRQARTARAVIVSLARVMARRDSSWATRAREAVAYRPNSAASAAITAVTESRPNTPKASTPRPRVRSGVVRRPSSREASSLQSLITLPRVASLASPPAEGGGGRRLVTGAHDTLGASHNGSRPMLTLAFNILAGGIVTAILLCWPRLAGPDRRRLALLSSGAGLVALILAMGAEGFRESPTVA